MNVPEEGATKIFLGEVEEIWMPTPNWSSAPFLPASSSFSFFSTLVVSTCHSLVVGIFGLYIVFFDEATIADPLWGDPSLVKVNLAIASGYAISDLLLLILYWEVIGDIFFVIHHCTMLYAYQFVLRGGMLAYLGNFRLLAELSSPFVNQRWFFEALKYPKFSKANVINGILMTVVFFMVRIATMPPFYSYIYSVFGTEAFMRLGFVIQCSWIGTCVILDVMNVMWMIKISRGCFKVISLFRQEKASNSFQNGKLD
ncbi:TLC domain-containing protein 4 isoform X2 [Dasypus novemcinctus]|uniref:TLC domain-containing protein 4 isoform X2 n=2 Tax=Dasypus novemcinctus TaxID=9361 RepID=UPI000328C637|nr:TLC domain-containing protein 4 isoform X2 [Dasypus novemcinctus]